MKVQVAGLAMVIIIDILSDYLHSTLDRHSLNSFWNNIIKHLLFSWLISVWMKVKVNILNTWCIIMFEAVTVPSLTMMTSTVSEKSFARDTNTDTRRDRQTHWETDRQTPGSSLRQNVQKSLTTLQTKTHPPKQPLSHDNCFHGKAGLTHSVPALHS